LKAATQRASVWSEVRVLKDLTFGTVEQAEDSAVTDKLSRATPKLFYITEHKTSFCKEFIRDHNPASWLKCLIGRNQTSVGLS